MEKTWYASSPGRFALSLQTNLLQTSLAAWPRRGKSLLEINCGNGLFLPLLWECGFDVTGTELVPGLRAQALENAGPRAHVEAAADDHLPFDDDAFDWVVLHVQAATPEGLAASAREALRVAAGGLAVTFWNSASLPHILHRLGRGKMPWPGPTHNWWRVWRMLKRLKVGHLTSQSTLVGPLCTWRRQCAAASCNAYLQTLPLGAWSVIRLDLAPRKPVTPLPLRLGRRRLRRPEPALEFGHKNALGHSSHTNRKTA